MKVTMWSTCQNFRKSPRAEVLKVTIAGFFEKSPWTFQNFCLDRLVLPDALPYIQLLPVNEFYASSY